MKKTRRSLLAILAIAFVAVLALVGVLGFAACGESEETPETPETPAVDTATLNRVAAATATDERLVVGTDLAFDGSSVTVTYDDTTKTYTLSGTSAAFGEDLAGAFWGSDNASTHASCEYITFVVNVNAGEKIEITTYNGSTVEKTLVMYGTETETDVSTADGAFVLDLSDHTTGDWKMELKITYADSTSATFTVVTGTITASTPADAE